MPVILGGSSQGFWATQWAMTANFNRWCSFDLPDEPCHRPWGHRNVKGASAVYHVVRSNGKIVVDGEAYDVEEGDTVAIPSWATTQLENASRTEELILFSFTNHYIYRMLDLYREELVPAS